MQEGQKHVWWISEVAQRLVGAGLLDNFAVLRLRLLERDPLWQTQPLVMKPTTCVTWVTIRVSVIRMTSALAAPEAGGSSSVFICRRCAVASRGRSLFFLPSQRLMTIRPLFCFYLPSFKCLKIPRQLSLEWIAAEPPAEVVSRSIWWSLYTLSLNKTLERKALWLTHSAPKAFLCLYLWQNLWLWWKTVSVEQ